MSDKSLNKPTTSSDSKKALVEAFDAVLKTQIEERAQLANARRSTGRSSVASWIAVFALLFTAAYLWLERPGWIFPSPPPPESAAVREASLRIALANAARHVEHFRHKNGRRPTTLTETGTLATGIRYELDGADGYLLRGENGSVRLILRSTDSLPKFVGNSFEIIIRRSR